MSHSKEALRDIWGRWEAWEFGNVWREGSTSEESEKDKNHRQKVQESKRKQDIAVEVSWGCD